MRARARGRQDFPSCTGNTRLRPKQQTYCARGRVFSASSVLKVRHATPPPSLPFPSLPPARSRGLRQHQFRLPTAGHRIGRLALFTSKVERTGSGYLQDRLRAGSVLFTFDFRRLTATSLEVCPVSSLNEKCRSKYQQTLTNLPS